MIDYRNIKPGQNQSADWDGQTVLVAAESADVFWVSKYVDGAPWKVAKLTHDPNAEYPWTVLPSNAMYDEEVWSNWGGALRSASDMRVDTGGYLL